MNFTDALKKMDGSDRARRHLVGALFAIGLFIWLAVQGALLLVPLFTRATFPEPDDIYGYLNKTRQMETCFFQDCPALEDLRPQLLDRSPNPAVQAERDLAATRVFPIYHFLLSGTLLGLQELGLDLEAGYRLIWTLSPLWFGAAFAYLLISVWGIRAAGPALVLLAFKVYPDTGLNLVAPSNLAMGLAAIVWARIISRQGRAPIALVAGSLALISLHPVGRIYAAMSVFFSFFLARDKKSRSLYLPIGLTLAILLASFVIGGKVERPYMLSLGMFPQDQNLFMFLISGAVRSIVEISANLVNLEAGLLGNPALFCAALIIGFITAAHERRQTGVKIVVIYGFFLFALLYYGPTQPADAFLRIWIPLVVILFGAVGQAVWFALTETRRYLIERPWQGEATSALRVRQAWPLILLTVLIGYSVQMASRGMEQVAATIQLYQQRQPLDFDPAQVALLSRLARPGDRVLYNSMIVMPYYFIHGGLDWGAVYYHPVMDHEADPWLTRPDIRFAALYQPTVYHPDYEGVQEHRWWISTPDYRHSPLSRRRTGRPLAREGKVHASDFQWIEVRPGRRTMPPDAEPLNLFRVLVENTGGPCRLELMVKDGDGKYMEAGEPKIVPPGWSGSIEWQGLEIPWDGAARLALPRSNNGLRIRGMNFGSDRLLWPWEQKASLTFMPKSGLPGEISVSFDPARMVPAPLNQKKIRVLHDKGSSVLLEFVEKE